MSSRPVWARRWAALLGFSLAALAAPTGAEARVTLTAANGVAYDLDDTGTGALLAQGALSGFPELCVRVCDQCDQPCAFGDLYDARGQASASELQGLQRILAPAAVNGLQVVRKVYVPSANPANANGFARYLDIISNPAAAPVTVTVRVGVSGATGGRLGQGRDTSVWRTQDDDAEAEPTDRWVMTDDLDPLGTSPAVSNLFFGAGARETPDRLGLQHPIPNDNTSLAADFRAVQIPAGGTVAFMTIVVVEPQRDAAIAEVQNLLGMTSEVLFGLQPAERARIVNFDIDPANPSPVADAGGPYNANEGEQVQLSAARSVDPVDNQALTYEWDLDGDGDYGDSIGANTIVRFVDDGVYILNVRVTDPQGKSDIDSARIVVRNVAPRVDAVTTDSPIDEGGLLTVSVIAQDPGADALTFDFDWDGDGNYDDVGSNQPRAQHQYFDDGDYTARVRVSDDDGGITEYDFPVVVRNLPPRLFEIVGNWPQLEGQEVAIQVIAQDPGRDPIQIGYDLDHDGTYELEGPGLDMATYSWPDNGQYTISVRLVDDQGATTVVEELIPILNANPEIVGVTNTGPVLEGSPVDLIVDAADTPADTLTYSFDLDNDDNFADDVVDQLPNVYTATYRQQGIYIVGVRVRDEDNGRAIGSTAVEVLNAPPVGSIQAPEFVDEGERFMVTVQAMDPGDDPVLFDWDVTGDGVYDLVNSVDTDQTLVFAQEGDITITVRAHDRDVGEILLNALVHVLNQEPVAELTIPDQVIEGGDTPVSCRAIDAGADALSYAFDFDGDNIYDIEGLGEGVASHVYDDQGFFTVTCAVDDGSNVVTVSRLVIVENAPPRVTLRSDAPVDEGGLVHLTATVADPSINDVVTLEWDLDGDGVVDVRDDPALERDLAAQDDARFLVTLIARDEDGGEATAQTEIIVRNLPPSFEDIAFLPRAREGVEWTYVVPVVDPAGMFDPLVFELLNPPPEVTIDPMSGFISWVPTYDQYRASPIHIGVGVRDGDGGRDEMELVVDVDFRDDDADGLPDTWEQETCDLGGVCLDPTNPDDADADPDMDGRTTREEFETGDDPFHYDGPPEPEPISPENGIRVVDANPALVIDPKDGDGNQDAVFIFEVYADADLQQKVIDTEAEPVVRGEDPNVSWQAPEGILIEDATYWWRARAILGPARTPWTPVWSFTVNANNNKPTTPILRAPMNEAEVNVKFPTFQAMPSEDLDGDEIQYKFYVYNNRDIIEVSGDGALNPDTGMIEFRPLQELVENATYTWKVTAIDIPPGEESEPGEIWSFTVNTENSPPDLPHFISPEEDETVTTLRPTLVAGGTRDLDSESLSIVFRVWYTDEDGMMTGDAPLIESEPVAVDAEGTASWPLPIDLEENVHFMAECYATDGPAKTDFVTQPFFVSVTDEAPPTPNLVAPLDGTRVSPSNVFMDWEDVQDPEDLTVKYIVTYCLQVAEGDARCTDTIELLDSGFGFPDAVHGATYLWHVVAVDAAGNKSAPSVEWSFVVDDLGTGESGGGGGSADGCGCRAVGAPATGAGWWMLMLFAGAGLRLRRRR